MECKIIWGIHFYCLRTVIFYESPYRLTKTLKDIEEVLDNPTVVCARELTKKFEEVKKDSAQKLREHFTKVAPKGEFVLIVHLMRCQPA